MAWWAVVLLVVFWSSVLTLLGLVIRRKLSGRPASRAVEPPDAYLLQQQGDLRLLRQPTGLGGGGGPVG